ncbi:hypothetical protein MTO98_12325 [Mucilaginibacter sp. SMC90]|uniref:hypothetical protein n=1 Tax=Mucilaginibacter sp. SMC90 TaxID=2929803 RepID=UPI001FB28450|nr:hypothetical protein [Mucilaginibacter sp. SMC90]UOE51865.1 hypothetical protein MTO98_12325 [Mucilaginibacter sp. SMC90]
MSRKEVGYYIFYIVCFILSVLSGIFLGFTDTHTPPVPFVIQFFTLMIGSVICIRDWMKSRPVSFKKIQVHIWGLVINGLVMGVILLLAFV